VTVHFATVPPGLNPGGLWVRQCLADELIDEHPLGLVELANGAIEDIATTDGATAGRFAEHGETVWTYIYDGDSGQCIATLRTDPSKERGGGLG
jgi:hypothetical protein